MWRARRSNLHEFEKAATIFQALAIPGFSAGPIGAAIVDKREGGKIEPLEQRHQGARRRHAMGVEADALATDRRRQIKPSMGRDDAFQFGSRFAQTVGVEWIAIAAEPDMLDDMQAGKRG